ncbi:MAG: tRNA pseudouridine(55) synthase TruB [Candidatus Calescibacterium sp.]|nr:tRNA pseudouridine(55) synthase TruB [Candidatus Calescibacterium sp.]MDW8133112.1 tRNA pseudouridine(55) synthase TruB [Candidatus Calescibacterium sp.]
MLVDGAIVINKSPGFTSTQYLEKVKTIVNQKLRKIYKEQGITGEFIEKAGHTGTLDPNASGVLVIFLNKSTKIIPFINKNKSYICEIILGKETDTIDNTGKTIKEIAINTEKAQKIAKDIEELLPTYIGKFNQSPPVYSSKKVQGKRLYELAPTLQSTIFQEKSNIVYIHSIKILNHYEFLNYQRIQMEIECSQGTYVRSIIKDISDKINFPLTLSFLVRKNSNNFTLSNSITIEELKNSENIVDKIIKLQDILNDFPFVIVNDKTVFRVRNGHSFSNQNTIHIEKKGKYNDRNIFVVKDRKKEFLALAQSDNMINFKVKKVLKPY